MMKKSMCALSVVLLVVAFVGCPIANQFLKTRLQGTWEYVDPQDPDIKATLEFDRNEVTRSADFLGVQISRTGTFEVVDSDTIEVTFEDMTQTWDIEFQGVLEKKFTLTVEGIEGSEEFTRVSFR